MEIKNTVQGCERATEAQSKSCNFIDIMKFICAMLVIAIHVPPFSGMNWVLNFAVVNFAARIAVPFFFTASAYFVFKKAYKTQSGELDKGVIIRYVKKIFRLYVIWSVIYMPFAYCHMSESAETLKLHWFLRSYTVNFVFSASYGHLWYLNAVIFAYLFLFLMLAAKIKPAVIAAFSLTAYCVGLCTQSWFGLVEPLSLECPRLWSFFPVLQRIFVTARNGLCEGLLFVLVGMFFATHDIKLKMKTALICLVCSFLFFAAEVFILAKLAWIREYDMYLGLIPITFFLFYVSLNINIPDRAIYRKMRTLSALIYFSHMLAVELLMLVPCLRALPGGGLTQYLFTFLASLVFSAAVIRLSEHFKAPGLLYK